MEGGHGGHHPPVPLVGEQDEAPRVGGREVRPRDPGVRREELLPLVPGYPERTYVTREMLRSMIADLVRGPLEGPAVQPFTDDLAPIETMSF